MEQRQLQTVIHLHLLLPRPLGFMCAGDAGSPVVIHSVPCELDGFPTCSSTFKLTACTDSKFLTL